MGWRGIGVEKRGWDGHVASRIFVCLATKQLKLKFY